jgi:hypothetical protein
MLPRVAGRLPIGDCDGHCPPRIQTPETPPSDYLGSERRGGYCSFGRGSFTAAASGAVGRAQRSSVYQLIMKEAGWLVGVGIGAGLACSVGAATLIRGLLFGVRSWDATTLAAVSGVLAISALLASFIPARRAAQVDPMVALRYE